MYYSLAFFGGGGVAERPAQEEDPQNGGQATASLPEEENFEEQDPGDGERVTVTLLDEAMQGPLKGYITQPTSYARPLIVVKFFRVPVKFSGSKTGVSWLRSWSW